MNWIVRLILLLTPSAGIADAGHDHGAPAALIPEAAGPRVEAQSETFELVGILEAGKLRIYLDRFATNEPVSNARIEIEGETFKGVAEADGEGLYTIAADALSAPGDHALVFAIQAGGDSDLLNGTLVLSQPAGPAPHSHDWGEWLVWIAGGAVIALGAFWLLLRRVTRLRAAAALAIPLAAMLMVAGMPAGVFADAGHDHGEEKKGSGKPEPGRYSARRLADGGVFMPKPVQRESGVRTLIAEVRELARTVELNGPGIADPNAGGRVQPSQAGRLEPGPRGLPNLGQKVAKGEVLAYVKPIAAAIELGNQRAQLAEISSQHVLAEKKVRRLEALEGSVPQKEIDAARAEVASLAERKAAVAGGLSAREALIAPINGVISAATVVAGQVVEAREVVFEVLDPQRLMVEALAYDAAIVSDIAHASGALPGGQALALSFVGGAPQLREQALPLLFRIKQPPALAVGQPLKVVAQTRQTIKGVAVPLAALAKNSSGDAVVWVHVGAETFAARKVRYQALDGASIAVTEGVAGSERVVVAGVPALAQVR